MIRVALAGFVALASGLILTACLPFIPGPSPITRSSPSSASVQTPSLEITASPLPTLTIAPSSTFSPVPTGTFTPIPSFTSTIGSTGAPVTASFTTAVDMAGTALPLNVTAILVTDTATPFGTPANLNSIYGPVHIQNKSHVQVDLSFHCTTSKGVEIIIEFNNVRNVVTTLPIGNYAYVMYMGGRRSIGSFSYLTVRKLTFTVYRDGVVIQ